MKLVVLCFFAAFYLVFSVACSPSNAAGPSKESSRVQEEASPFGQTLLVKSIQQFEDRQPIATEDGAPQSPRTITVVNFETEACADARDEDFAVQVSRKGQTALARIVSNREACESSARRAFQVGTGALRTGESIVVTNPTLVETLPATE